jgi:hypothetical protein
MLTKIVRSSAALVLSFVAIGFAGQPARADTTSTLIITAAAAVGLMTAINVAQKNAKAHQIVGYLPDGSTVYADGHVVGRGGQSWYPGNYGQTIACNGQQCSVAGGSNVGYGAPYGNGYPGTYGGYPNAGYPNAAYPNAGYPNGYPSGYGYPNGYPSGYAYPNGYPNGYGAPRPPALR